MKWGGGSRFIVGDDILEDAVADTLEFGFDDGACEALFKALPPLPLLVLPFAREEEESKAGSVPALAASRMLVGML